MNDIEVVYWREFRRQRHLYRSIAMQLIFIVLLLAWKFEDLTVFSFFIYTTFLFSILSQNDIYFYDLIPSIETILATPLNVVQVLRAKGRFVFMKSVLLVIAVFPVYLIMSYNNGVIPKKLVWEEALLLVLLLVLQYSLSKLIGVLAWAFGKKTRIGIIIGQGLILNGFMAIHTWNFTRSAAIIALSIVMIYAISTVFLKRISKEKLIMRCL